jgi:hypothetical protein
MLLTVALLAGCGDGAGAPAAGPAPGTSAQSGPAVTGGAGSDGEQAGPSPAPAFAPIRLGAEPGAEASAAGAAPTGTATGRPAILQAMMPLQIMLGKWRGTTQREFGDFKALDEPQWVWDFQTDRNRPAMVMTSEGSPYFREARLTYLTDKKLFDLRTVDKDGQARRFEGDFTQPPQDVPGDDKKLQRTYTLALTELEPAEAKDQWQVLFSQVDNNRYRMELYRKRMGRFARFDTVGTQREGTSFALNDEDYGERKCIISGGLGTIQVSYQGKSYWVCCTGCQAAFNEDPASWIAEFEAKQKK